MLHATIKKGSTKGGLVKGRPGRPSRWPDICADAETLGVNRVTLYRALTGKWNLPGLVQRYEELQRTKGPNQ